MPTYVMLMYGDSEGRELTPAEFDRLLAEHRAYPEVIASLGGKVVGSEALEPPDKAKTVRTGRRSGAAGPPVTDGPYAELKEQLGGFYIFEADSMETAVEIAERSPEPVNELREIMTFD